MYLFIFLQVFPHIVSLFMVKLFPDPTALMNCWVKIALPQSRDRSYYWKDHRSHSLFQWGKRPRGKCQTLNSNLIFRHSHEIVMHRSVISVMGLVHETGMKNISGPLLLFLLAVKTLTRVYFKAVKATEIEAKGGFNDE